jgi:integrase
MSRRATGTVVYRAGNNGGPGSWVGRITCSDGTRPRVKLGEWPNNAQGRARAKETAAHYAERFRSQGIVGVPQRGSKALAERATAPRTEGRLWFEGFFEHRRSLGLGSSEGAYRTHIQPVLDKPWEEVTVSDCERLRDALDAKANSGESTPKTVFNAWTVFTTAAKAASGQWKKDKQKKLRVRADNPCLGVAPPDLDDAKELQWLYPDEVLTLLSCEQIPLDARRAYALGVYLFLRAGELKALSCRDIDLTHGLISVRRSFDRSTGTIKQTKTGNKGNRRFAIEETLLPLLRAMHAEAGGEGPVVELRLQKWWAADLRKHLRAAGIVRPELFETDATRKELRFHDLRSTGITWMAIRGDDPLKIQQRAGHASFEMTQKYIRTAEAVGKVIGEVFPKLPECLLAGANRPANRPGELQLLVTTVEAPGIEQRRIRGMLGNPRTNTANCGNRRSEILLGDRRSRRGICRVATE